MNYRVIVAVAPLRKESSDRSEMVSQALFGEELMVLERHEKWSMIKMNHDGYEGWIDNKQFDSGAHLESVKLLTSPLTRCLMPTDEAIWLPAGSMVPQFWNLDAAYASNADIPIHVESYAQQFLNAPYLWGGRTIMGIDCSGFTQLVMRMSGYSLPRDAYQQAEMGATISFVEEAQTGDLAFFDNTEGRITHVGIVMRKADGTVQIIHASGKVRIDVLDHQGIYNLETAAYSHKLRIIRRISAV